VMLKSLLSSFSGKHSLFPVFNCPPQCMTCIIDVLITYFKWRSIRSFVVMLCEHHTDHSDIQKRCNSLKPCFYGRVIVKKSVYKVQNTDEPHLSCFNFILRSVTALDLTEGFPLTAVDQCM
jgi:hypothetical protein